MRYASGHNKRWNVTCLVSKVCAAWSITADLVLMGLDCIFYTRYRIYERQQKLGVEQDWSTLSWMDYYRQEHLGILTGTDPFWRTKGHRVHTLGPLTFSTQGSSYSPSIPAGSVARVSDNRSDNGISFEQMLIEAKINKELWEIDLAERPDIEASHTAGIRQMPFNEITHNATVSRPTPTGPAAAQSLTRPPRRDRDPAFPPQLASVRHTASRDAAPAQFEMKAVAVPRKKARLRSKRSTKDRVAVSYTHLTLPTKRIV